MIKPKSALGDLDSRLFQLSKALSSYPRAINEQAAKARFLSDKKYKTPKFIWQKPECDLNDVRQKLASIRIPKNHPLTPNYQARLRELKLLRQLKHSLGTSRHLAISKSLYGAPSTKLVKLAQNIARQPVPTDTSSTVSVKSIQASLQRAIKAYGIRGWNVVLSNKPVIDVAVEKKEIHIPRRRSLTRNELTRICVHEINAHVLTAENGYLQPFAIFAHGFAGYQETQEGLAIYLESKLSSDLAAASLRFHAGKVIAVDSMLHDQNFVKTFNIMCSYNYSKDQAWSFTYRAYRGGGFTKDYIYLSGFYKIKRFLAQGGKLPDLYVGKIALSDLPLIRKLLRQKLIKPPHYLPRNH